QYCALLAIRVFCRQRNSYTVRQTTAHCSMKPRFEPNPDAASTREAQRLIDPEAFEASEQQFAASLESMELLSAARFVVDHAPGDVTGFAAEPPDSSASKQRQSPAEEKPSYTTHSETSSIDVDLEAAVDPGARA